MEEREILCGASSYEKLFYFNPDFGGLPKEVQEELQVICVLFTSDVGGTIRFEFDPEGNLLLTVEAKDDDYFFDEIGSGLRIRDIQLDHRELLEELEMYYRVFFLGEDAEGGE